MHLLHHPRPGAGYFHMPPTSESDREQGMCSYRILRITEQMGLLPAPLLLTAATSQKIPREAMRSGQCQPGWEGDVPTEMQCLMWAIRRGWELPSLAGMCVQCWFPWKPSKRCGGAASEAGWSIGWMLVSASWHGGAVGQRGHRPAMG